jgi:alanine racemase
MNFLSKIFNFSRGFSQKIQTLNHIYILKEAILNNFDTIQALNPGKAVFPVLKSNAYGHGITQIASILKERKLDYIVVDSYYEALKVWEVNPVKILLIGYMLEENLSKMNFKKIDLVVYDTQIIHALGKLGKKVNIHIKIDTGMNRQ